MKSKTRMAFEQRQQNIIERVREVFAQKGLEGTTTRELACAAGISEGLLFKHFPTKEALFHGVLESTDADFPPGEARKSLTLEPSTETLVSIVHNFVSMLISINLGETQFITRIYLRSLAGDGEFAHFLLRKPQEDLIPALERSIDAAAASGDIIDSPVSSYLRSWFVERLSFIIMTDFLPPVPVVDYGVSRESLVKDTVWFLLRGIGLKEEVIRRCYPDGVPTTTEV